MNETALRSELAIRMRRFRRELGASLDAVATKTGLTRGFLSKVERGLAIPSTPSAASPSRSSSPGPAP